MSDTVRTGLDILHSESCERLKIKRIGLLANPASVTADLVHAVSVLRSGGVELISIFGPQHGFRGNTQANMIEWEGYTHPELGIPVYSLYGEHREPSDTMLEGCERIVIDLPDIGARPYTYLWTAVLMMRRCAEARIPVTVLDRPNPIGGAAVEGPLIAPGYTSFVGLYPLPMRHGLTFGEALSMIHHEEHLAVPLDVIRVTGWRREISLDGTSLPWIAPSPNVPTLRTALLYPGMVMIEGTNISEGRGTTQPFEIIGAPWIEPHRLAEDLAVWKMPGVTFRPLSFTPTWDKYAGELCGGVQIHVTEPSESTPVRCGAAVIAATAARYPDRFAWLDPPYEYEYRIPPIDILSGSDHLRNVIDDRGDIRRLFERWRNDEETFSKIRAPHLLY